jgi:hypothetical protein
MSRRKIKKYGKEYINISDREMCLFLNEIAANVGKWYRGILTQKISQLFPRDVVMLFILWKEERVCDNAELRGEKAARILRRFETALTDYGVKWKRVPSKSVYCRSQGKYQYKLSCFRLLPAGMKLLLKFPSNQ